MTSATPTSGAVEAPPPTAQPTTPQGKDTMTTTTSATIELEVQSRA